MRTRSATTTSCRALGLLVRDFDAPDGLGPSRAADFMLAVPQDRDADAADAHGFVDDLLVAARRLVLMPPKDAP